MVVCPALSTKKMKTQFPPRGPIAIHTAFMSPSQPFTFCISRSLCFSTCTSSTPSRHKGIACLKRLRLYTSSAFAHFVSRAALAPHSHCSSACFAANRWWRATPSAFSVSTCSFKTSNTILLAVRAANFAARRSSASTAHCLAARDFAASPCHASIVPSRHVSVANRTATSLNCAVRSCMRCNTPNALRFAVNSANVRASRSLVRHHALSSSARSRSSSSRCLRSRASRTFSRFASSSRCSSIRFCSAAAISFCRSAARRFVCSSSCRARRRAARSSIWATSRGLGGGGRRAVAVAALWLWSAPPPSCSSSSFSAPARPASSAVCCDEVDPIAGRGRPDEVSLTAVAPCTAVASLSARGGYRTAYGLLPLHALAPPGAFASSPSSATESSTFVLRAAAALADVDGAFL
mmetsp:Transcript_3785/g.9222  ORF Transcript_3785/g.9222 Transcript_3785/m.9222 type:complete len:408 (-) Transcript_3785:2248-3471(-)